MHDPVFNTRAACSSLPPDASSVRAPVQALFAATKIAQHPLLFRRLRPHDGRDNPDRSQRPLEQTLASLRDASPALERAAPQRVCPPLLFEKRWYLFCRNLFRQSLYIFRLGIRAVHNTIYEKRQICRFLAHQQLVVAHQEPEAVSGGRSQAGTPWQGGDSAG
jgi:hypothetical protein